MTSEKIEHEIRQFEYGVLPQCQTAMPATEKSQDHHDVPVLVPKTGSPNSRVENSGGESHATSITTVRLDNHEP